LTAATVQATLQYTSALATLAGASSASVARLTQGVVMMMFLSPLKTACVVLLAMGLGAASVGVWAQVTLVRPEKEHWKSYLEVRLRQHEEVQKRQDRTVTRFEELGAKVQRDVVSISFESTQVTDGELGNLFIFPHLRILSLGQTTITDTGV